MVKQRIVENLEIPFVTLDDGGGSMQVSRAGSILPPRQLIVWL